MKRRGVRDERGFSEIVIVLLVMPVVLSIILVLINIFILAVASMTLPSTLHTGAVMTAAAGSGTRVVPYVPTGGVAQSAEQYVRTQLTKSLFFGRIDRVTCNVPSGAGEALSVARCTVTYHPMVIGSRIFDNSIFQLFGGPMTVVAEDISQTGTNQNVQ